MEQAAENDPLIGAQVGNYEVKSKLGEGGMGSVYLAEHPLIGKKVALKVLHSEFSSNEDVVSRFFTEAKAVNDIQHPNIVDIIDYGVIPDQAGNNMVYFIMEFLGGRSLADVIRQEAPIAPERALAICVQIADALATSHRGNIVHRDLKPDNVILIDRARQPDFVKVLDFGIAKLTGDQPGSRRTRTGIVMGTPAYMSPEQCEGKGEVDHRTDVYALGILLYEMLTGRVPFQGEGYGEVLVQHLTQAPQKPSTIRGVIPPHVEAVCLKALEKSAGARYQSMDDFMQALADPVQYVEARGGVEGFTSANLGAPAPTPYPPAQAPTVSPAMGQTPYTPAPGQLSPVQGAGAVPQQGSWPTPAPGAKRSRLPVIVLSSVVALGLAIGGIVALGSGGDEEVASTEETEETDTAEETEEGTEEAIAGTEETPEEETVEEKTGGETETGQSEESEEKIETPPQPVMVKIKVESKPPGALVFLEGSDEPEGKTPVSFEVEKGSEQLSVRLERDGYKTRQKRFVPSSNSSIEVLLHKDRRRVVHGGRGRGRDRNKDKDKGKNEDKSVGETGLLPLE